MNGVLFAIYKSVMSSERLGFYSLWIKTSPSVKLTLCTVS